jgi:hypothetical protein
LSKRSNRVIFIAILLLITYQLISVAYTAWGSSSDLETDDDPLNINMTLQITTFSTDSRITGKLNFTACSNDTIDFVIFLPSAIGPSLVRVDSESYVKNTSTGLFEYTYKNPNFNGKCYSRGWLFPFDSYELVFILSFNENTEIERGDIPLTIFFEDRTYYSDWKIEQTLKEKTKNQVLNLVNYVAPNKEEMAQAIEENSLEKFFVVEGKILPF